MRQALVAPAIIVAALMPALLPMAGCQAAEEPPTSDVLALSVCPPDTPCGKIADGASQITLEGCIPKSVEVPRRDLMAEFRIADGAFVDPLPITSNPKIVRVPLTNRCAVARFKTPLDPQLLRVQLQLLTNTNDENPPANSYLPYSQSQNIAIEPAPVSFVTFAPIQPFTELTTSFEVDTIVRTRVGNPSNGTQVQLTIIPASAVITPGRATVGSTATTFRATVLPGSASAVTITAVATPPNLTSGAEAPATTSSITLVRATTPPPASTE